MSFSGLAAQARAQKYSQVHLQLEGGGPPGEGRAPVKQPEGKPSGRQESGETVQLQEEDFRKGLTEAFWSKEASRTGRKLMP